MAITKVTEGVRTLGTDEVLTAKINDDAVTAAKLATGAAVPADDSITDVKINSSAAIAQSKLANVGKYTSAATAPGSPSNGDVWYDTSVNSMKVSAGGVWVTMGGLGTATGGNTTNTYTVGGVDYKSHTFTTSGTFSVQTFAIDIDVLIVAGGGASGGYALPAGGGAGGLPPFP